MTTLYIDSDSRFLDLHKYLDDNVVELVNSRDDADFELKIASDYQLNCTLEEFARFLEWSLSRDGFDAIFLAELYDSSVIHRVKPGGCPNIIVKPPIFTHKKGLRATINKGKQKQQLVVHDNGSTSYGIKVSALAFFLLIVCGFAFALIYTRKRRST